MVKVELTRHLHAFLPQREGKEVLVQASTVVEVVRELERLAPGIAFDPRDERGRLRTHVNVFLGERRVADRTRLSDPVEPEARVFVFQALSRG